MSSNFFDQVTHFLSSDFGSIPTLAQAAGEAAKTPQWVGFAPMVLIGVFFYVFLIRPQQKESKRRQSLLGALKKNDKVFTSGGLIGTIAEISGDGLRVTLKVDDNTRIKFLRSSIQGVLDEKTESAS